MSRIPVSHVSGIKNPSITSSTPLEVNKKTCITVKKEPPKMKFSDSAEFSLIEKSVNSAKSTPREPLKTANTSNQLKRCASNATINIVKKQPKLAPKTMNHPPAKIAPHDYKARYDNLFQKHAELKKRNEELSDQSETNQNKIENLESEKLIFLKDLEDLKSDNSKYQIETKVKIDNINRENVELSSQLSETKAKLQFKTDEYDKLKEMLDEQLKKNIMLSFELNDSQTKLSSCTSEITFLKAKQTIIEKTNNENNDKISNMKIENETISEKLKMLEEQHELLKNNLNMKTQECDKFIALYNNEKFESTNLFSKNAELLKELNSVKAEKDYLKRKTEEHCLDIANLHQKNDELQKNIENMHENQKILRNVIQDLKGHIRVFCRIKPVMKEENSKVALSVDIVDSSTMEIEKMQVNSTSGLTKKNSKLSFTFDGVFPSHASQAEIFEEVSSLIQSALDGYNVCIFAYGQTGSGKTYTMEGDVLINSSGIIPRAIDMIFDNIPKLQELGWDFKITASFLEIYNENIYDLLDSSKDQMDHNIKMVDSKGTDIYISNLKEESVNTSTELNKLLIISQKNRLTAATLCNERSSRSHSIMKIKIVAYNKQRGEKYSSYLNMVDLAGSESGKTSQRMDETKSINKSLSELSKVILALQAKQAHVPYRNSKLTHLLMPSLGGNSKTLMLVNISQLDECYNETVNSLRFASKVNSCRTGVSKKNVSSL